MLFGPYRNKKASDCIKDRFSQNEENMFFENVMYLQLTYFENMEIGLVNPYFIFYEKISALIAGVRLPIF